MSQEITLDALANRNQSPVDANTSYHTVDVEIAPDHAQIAAKAETIDLLDSQAIAVYGEQSYRNMLAYGQQLLAHVRTNDFGGIDEKLAQLTDLVKNLNVEQMSDGGVWSKLSFLRRSGSGIRTFEKRFGAALEQSAQTEAELVSLAAALREDKTAYDELLRTKAPLLLNLSLDIQAAKQMLDVAHDETLPQLEAEAEVSDDAESKKLVDDYRQRAAGFTTQVEDLENAQKVFADVAPHVVSVQANNLQLADKISQITGKILPYWKSQIALAISMVKEQELLKQKREALKRAQKQSGGEEYGAATHAEDLQLVDLDAVKKINNNLLSTIADAAILQRAGKAVRLDTEATLLRLDGRVRQAMITAAAFGDEIVPEPILSSTKAEPELEHFDETSDLPDDLERPMLLEDDELAELEDQQLTDDIAWSGGGGGEAPWSEKVRADSDDAVAEAEAAIPENWPAGDINSQWAEEDDPEPSETLTESGETIAEIETVVTENWPGDDMDLQADESDEPESEAAPENESEWTEPVPASEETPPADNGGEQY